MELKLINDKGAANGTVAASAELFGRDYNEALVHQVVTAYQANARSGNRAQKGRSDVKKVDQEALASKRYGPRPCRYGVFALVARWR